MLAKSAMTPSVDRVKSVWPPAAVPLPHRL
jgi:hypothetical protein